MRDLTPDQIRETEAIEKYVQRQILDARDALDHLLRTTTRWHEALEAHDPVEAERWQIETGRRWKQASSSTQTASLLRRQAASGILHADQNGSITAGFPARQP